MALLGDQFWMNIEAMLRNLPSFNKVETTARTDIEAACRRLLHARNFYTQRAPDPKREIADLNKTEKIALELRSHLYGFLRRRGGYLLNISIDHDPYYTTGESEINPPDPESIEAIIQKLRIVDFIKLSDALAENCRWFSEHLEDDVLEYSLKGYGPRSLYDEKEAFCDFMAVWVKSGGPRFIQYRDDLDPDSQHFGPTLDYLLAIFDGLADGKISSKIKFTKPSPSTLRAWCVELDRR